MGLLANKSSHIDIHVVKFICGLCLWPKEVQKSNFRQYGQMEKQSQEESDEGKEERRSEKRKSQKKEAAGLRSGRMYFVAPEGPRKVEKVGSPKAAAGEAISGDETLKIAPCCGGKHVSKSKYKKHCLVGALLEVQIRQSTKHAEVKK